MKKALHIISDIGLVEIIKRRQNRRIIVKSGNHQVCLRVSVPYYVSFDEALGFVHKNIDTIRNKLINLKSHSIIPAVINEGFNYKNAFFSVKIERVLPLSPKKEVELCQNGREYIIRVDEKLDLQNEKMQEKLLFYFEKIIRKEAKQYLPDRLKQLSALHNIPFHSVKINNARTRWGSCSSNNQINLTLKLMLLPAHLIDYVLLHELAHVVHKNHSPKFWAFLSSLTDDILQKRNELKKYNL
ncbi:MAG TPA: SprT family zinc-dependent metalloprotease [Bacteroidales bacterium]|nr:SprT family zinc-dependent metalloprotease [Bacteroidales bacterium]